MAVGEGALHTDDYFIAVYVTGELAVNPGLAAIWLEEKERLQKDVLEDSQRTTPQQTSSEDYLIDKLNKNLKLEVQRINFLY